MGFRVMKMSFWLFERIYEYSGECKGYRFNNVTFNTSIHGLTDFKDVVFVY